MVHTYMLNLSCSFARTAPGVQSGRGSMYTQIEYIFYIRAEVSQWSCKPLQRFCGSSRRTGRGLYIFKTAPRELVKREVVFCRYGCSTNERWVRDAQDIKTLQVIMFSFLKIVQMKLQIDVNTPAADSQWILYQ